MSSHFSIPPETHWLAGWYCSAQAPFLAGIQRFMPAQIGASEKNYVEAVYRLLCTTGIPTTIGGRPIACDGFEPGKWKLALPSFWHEELRETAELRFRASKAGGARVRLSYL